ncbi:SPOC domain-like protein [Cantharellus anzutake]|uniref:SPOC domain-like protein n=1 Tax=Cantharellus anzutake TaxID=1750568 RepID=UPI00190799E6|nr:SPOC domain-like protein [Cantharellus anzutake]KAF8330432.1 SPOC domain-like protein [Cantharellus anzutake]
MAGKERAGYTVTMFVIDVSPSMGEERKVEVAPGPNGEPIFKKTTKLEWSLKYVKHKIQQMIFAGRKSDKCGVILFGTEGTNNVVSDVHGGYDHVTEFLPIHQPNARTLYKLDTIKPSSTVGDPLDGIIVALSTQQDELAKKPSWNRRAIVITDGECPMEVDNDDMSGVTDKVNQWNVDLTVVGVDFDDENYPYDGPEKSNIKMANEKFWQKFISLTQSGSMGTLAYALQVTQSPEIKITRSTLSKTTLSIGDIHIRPDESIEILVKTGKATSGVTPPSLKKFTMRTDSESLKESQNQQQQLNPVMPSLEDVAPLEMSTQYVVKEDNDVDDVKAGRPARSFEDDEEGGDDEIQDPFENAQRLEKEDLIRAYKYGSTWVPIEDESADKVATVKGLQVVGFSYEDLWIREWSMGEVYYIFADDKVPRSQVAFASFVRAMKDYGVPDKKTGENILRPVLAIIRKVTSDGSPPKVGVACARSLEDVDYLVWVRMPFADDIRRYSFPSLEILKDKNGNKKTSHPNLPTDEMMDAMSELVDSGDLSAAGEKDESGNRLPWFDPSEAVHPAVHRIKEAIFHAAITSNIEEDPIPPPHPEIIKFLDPPSPILVKSRGPVQRCKSLFNIQEAPPRPKMRRKTKGAEDGLSADADVPLTLADLMNGDAYIPEFSPSPTLVDASEDSGGTTVAASPLQSLKAKATEKHGEDAMDVDLPSNKEAFITGKAAKLDRIIGNAYPLRDFRENTARGDLVTKAVSDMGEVIPEIVESSFSSQRFEEALECMRAMRDMALKEDEVDTWNGFIRTFKKQCRSSNFKHPNFWDSVKKEGVALSLIHEKEAQQNGNVSEVSLNASKKFIEE